MRFSLPRLLSRWRGFTLIEILVAALLVTWVIRAIFDIMFVAQNRFSKEQGEIFCAREAAFFLATLNRDMENCQAAFPPDKPLLDSVRSVFAISGSHLWFQIKTKEGQKPVDYLLDETKHEFQRVEEATVHSFCSGKAASFSVIMKFLTNDGLVFSHPDDPEIAFEPPIPAQPQIVRVWLKMRIALEIPRRGGQPRVFQDYRFLLFPVEGNTRLNSIWRWGTTEK